jgi:hypothetical protein
MIRERGRSSRGIRRQISPFAQSGKNMVHSYFGRVRACMGRQYGSDGVLPIRSECSVRADRQACYPREAARATTTSKPGLVIGGYNMHACNHTKNFISDMSHFWMDAKYLIMANTQAPVGIWICDGRVAVFAPG